MFVKARRHNTTEELQSSFVDIIAVSENKKTKGNPSPSLRLYNDRILETFSLVK